MKNAIGKEQNIEAEEKKKRHLLDSFQSYCVQKVAAFEPLSKNSTSSNQVDEQGGIIASLQEENDRLQNEIQALKKVHEDGNGKQQDESSQLLEDFQSKNTHLQLSITTLSTELDQERKTKDIEMTKRKTLESKMHEKMTLLESEISSLLTQVQEKEGSLRTMKIDHADQLQKQLQLAQKQNNDDIINPSDFDAVCAENTFYRDANKKSALALNALMQSTTQMVHVMAPDFNDQVHRILQITREPVETQKEAILKVASDLVCLEKLHLALLPYLKDTLLRHGEERVKLQVRLQVDEEAAMEYSETLKNVEENLLESEKIEILLRGEVDAKTSLCSKLQDQLQSSQATCGELHGELDQREMDCTVLESAMNDASAVERNLRQQLARSQEQFQMSSADLEGQFTRWFHERTNVRQVLQTLKKLEKRHRRLKVEFQSITDDKHLLVGQLERVNECTFMMVEDVAGRRRRSLQTVQKKENSMRLQWGKEMLELQSQKDQVQVLLQEMTAREQRLRRELVLVQAHCSTCESTKDEMVVLTTKLKDHDQKRKAISDQLLDSNIQKDQMQTLLQDVATREQTLRQKVVSIQTQMDKTSVSSKQELTLLHQRLKEESQGRKTVQDQLSAKTVQKNRMQTLLEEMTSREHNLRQVVGGQKKEQKCTTCESTKNEKNRLQKQLRDESVKRTEMQQTLSENNNQLEMMTVFDQKRGALLKSLLSAATEKLHSLSDSSGSTDSSASWQQYQANHEQPKKQNSKSVRFASPLQQGKTISEKEWKIRLQKAEKREDELLQAMRDEKQANQECSMVLVNQFRHVVEEFMLCLESYGNGRPETLRWKNQNEFLDWIHGMTADIDLVSLSHQVTTTVTKTTQISEPLHDIDVNHVLAGFCQFVKHQSENTEIVQCIDEAMVNGMDNLFPFCIQLLDRLQSQHTTITTTSAHATISAHITTTAIVATAPPCTVLDPHVQFQKTLAGKTFTRWNNGVRLQQQEDIIRSSLLEDYFTELVLTKSLMTDHFVHVLDTVNRMWKRRLLSQRVMMKWLRNCLRSKTKTIRRPSLLKPPTHPKRTTTSVYSQ